MSKTLTDVLAWGFLVFTVLLVMALLWLWWEERRDVARRNKATPKNSD